LNSGIKKTVVQQRERIQKKVGEKPGLAKGAGARPIHRRKEPVRRLEHAGQKSEKKKKPQSEALPRGRDASDRGRKRKLTTGRGDVDTKEARRVGRKGNHGMAPGQNYPNQGRGRSDSKRGRIKTLEKEEERKVEGGGNRAERERSRHSQKIPPKSLKG